MAAPNVNGRLHLTGVHQKPPAYLDCRSSKITDFELFHRDFIVIMSKLISKANFHTITKKNGVA